MKSTLILITFFIINCSLIYAQTIYTSATGRIRSPQEVETMREIYRREYENYQFDRLRSISERSRANNNSPDYSYTTTVETLPKDITDKAKKYVVLNEKFKTEYKNLLKSPNTGITKFLPETACIPNESEKKRKFDNLIEQCPTTFINGNGKYYSFRQNEYVTSKLADVGIQGDWIFSLGLFNQGFLVNIGDVPLEQISLSTKGADFISNFSPALSIKESDEQFIKFENGVVNEGLLYQKLLPLEVGKSYILRVIAYKIDYSYDKATSIGTIKYFPLKDDKREDIIIAFKILDKDEEGSTTMIWKELKTKESPELIIPNQESKEKPKK